MAYTTTALVKTYLSVTSSADDTLIGTLILRAQSMIDRYTGRTFESASDTTKYFDAKVDVYGVRLYFSEGFELAQAPTTITNGDNVVVVINTNAVLVPANTAPFYAIEMLNMGSMTWTYDANGDPNRAISVLGRWAYSITAPDDVVSATIRLVSFLYRQRETSADMDRPLSVGDGMILLPSRFPADIATILEPYRRYSR